MTRRTNARVAGFTFLLANQIGDRPRFHMRDARKQRCRCETVVCPQL